MDEVISGDWKNYAVQGEPETDSHTNEACRPFAVTRHAAHIRAALDIVRDNRIRPAAINDISLFTCTELQVVFASPLVWGTGSRYGCTQFTFDWLDLLKRKRVYWV